MTFETILKHADIFLDLTLEQIERIASICEEKYFDIGEIVFEEKSDSDELYIIARGQVEILFNLLLTLPFFLSCGVTLRNVGIFYNLS